jgi:hypothetical protein
MPGFHCKPGRKPHGFPEAATHTVALHRVSLAFRDGKTDPWFGFRSLSIQDFQKKSASAPFLARLNGKEIRPVFQPTGHFLLICHLPRLSSGNHLIKRTDVRDRERGELQEPCGRQL